MNIKVELKLAKETPGTYRYDNEDRDAAITALYIRKSAMPDPAPDKVTLEVTA